MCRHVMVDFIKLCSNHLLNMDTLVVIGSDGAAVMMGNQIGVVPQLKPAVPIIV